MFQIQLHCSERSCVLDVYYATNLFAVDWSMELLFFGVVESPDSTMWIVIIEQIPRTIYKEDCNNISLKANFLVEVIVCWWFVWKSIDHRSTFQSVLPLAGTQK